MKTITALITILIRALARAATRYNDQLLTRYVSCISALGAYQVGSRRAKRPPPP